MNSKQGSNFIYLSCRKLYASCSFASGMAVFLNAIQHIIKRSAKKHVPRVNTRRIVSPWAIVTHKQPSGYGATNQFPGNSLRCLVLSVAVFAISIPPTFGTYPNPTRVSLVDVPPKPPWKRVPVLDALHAAKRPLSVIYFSLSEKLGFTTGLTLPFDCPGGFREAFPRAKYWVLVFSKFKDGLAKLANAGWFRRLFLRHNDSYSLCLDSHEGFERPLGYRNNALVGSV